jgi:hypothetical protein
MTTPTGRENPRVHAELPLLGIRPVEVRNVAAGSYCGRLLLRPAPTAAGPDRRGGCFGMAAGNHALWRAVCRVPGSLFTVVTRHRPLNGHRALLRAARLGPERPHARASAQEGDTVENASDR